MVEIVTIGNLLFLGIQLLLSCNVVSSKSFECFEGNCAMTGSCRSSPGAGFSPFCWIASDSWGHKLKCGTRSDCRSAALSWGNCVFLSCAFDRGSGRSCDRMNREKLGELKKECGSEGFSFDSWANRYEKARKLYDKFSPCVGDAIEDETKKVIKYCHCFNSCGKDQTEDGTCTVQGLDRRLDMELDVKSPYTAVCAIDCEPEEKLVFLQKVINRHPTEKATKKVIITKGMSSSKSTSSGGSSSATVSGEVGFNVMKLFDVKIGASGTLEHNWSLSTTRTEFQQVTSEISIGVKPGDEVSVFQVVGECKNSDGTVYTVKTPTYVIKGKDGSSETKEADFSEAEKRLSKRRFKTFYVSSSNN